MVAENLEINNLVKTYPGGFNLMIDRLSIDTERILVLIGPNGSGKSTLIKLINLLEKPDSGSIIFNGLDILGKNVDKTAARKKMSVVFQEPLLFNTSVYNNILMGLSLRKIKLKEKKDLLEYLVQKLRLKALLRRNPKSLSGGEQQRVSLARALILEPGLLLLDEPLANIDQLSKEMLRVDLFEILKNTGRSTIYVTHDRNEAMIIADYIAVINNGRIEQSGQKDEVFRKPLNEFVARFVGVETLAEGRVIERSNNVCRIMICNHTGRESYKNPVIFAVGKEDAGERVMMAIRPEDVTLYISSKFLERSSALNTFEGTVTDIQDIGIFKKVEIECGFKLVSFVTQNSIEKLEILPGKKILASIKASSVHLFRK